MQTAQGQNSTATTASHDREEPVNQNSTSTAAADQSGEQTNPTNSDTENTSDDLNEGDEDLSQNNSTAQSSGTISSDNEAQHNSNSTSETSVLEDDSAGMSSTDPNSDSNSIMNSSYQESNQTSGASDYASSSGNTTNSTSNSTSSNSTNTDQANYYQNGTSISSSHSESSDVQPSADVHQNGSSSNTSPQAIINSTGTNGSNSTHATQSTPINSTSEATNSTSSGQNSTSLYSPELPPPDFKVSIDPLITSIKAGSSATYSITVSSLNGFNSTVSLIVKSAPIPGVTVSLSSNMTKLLPNASTALSMVVQSDLTAESGEYRLKVASSSANVTKGETDQVILEIIGRNSSMLHEDPKFDPVALTPLVIRDLREDIIGSVSSNEMVLLSTTLKNNYDKTQPFFVVMEVRDKASQVTLALQLQKGVLNPSGQAEIAMSWVPDRVGVFEIRSFVISKLNDPNPEPLSAVVGKTITVVDAAGISDYDTIRQVLER